MNRRTVLGFIIVLALSLGLLSTALAHAKLVSSDPAAGAKLTAAPAKVTLVFSEEIDEQGSSFTVTDAKKATVGSGKLDLNDLDHKTLTGTLNAGVGDGVYTVAWDVITSDDKAEESGTFTFGVNADPGPQPTAEAEEREATAAPTAAANPTATTRPTTAAAGAAQPTTAATVQPTAAAGGASPGNLPNTGDSGTNLSGFALLAAVMLLAGGVALYRSRVRMR